MTQNDWNLGFPAYFQCLIECDWKYLSSYRKWPIFQKFIECYGASKKLEIYRKTRFKVIFLLIVFMLQFLMFLMKNYPFLLILKKNVNFGHILNYQFSQFQSKFSRINCWFRRFLRQFQVPDSATLCQDRFFDSLQKVIFLNF